MLNNMVGLINSFSNRLNHQHVQFLSDMFAKLQTRRDIPQLAKYVFQYRNAGLVKYTYCRYTAVQPTLFEVTDLWNNFYGNIAKLQNDETPQIANFSFHCRNAVLVKYVNVL